MPCFKRKEVDGKNHSLPFFLKSYGVIIWNVRTSCRWGDNWAGYLASWARTSVSRLTWTWGRMLLDGRRSLNLAVYVTQKYPWSEAFTWLRETLVIQPVLNGLVAESSSWCCFIWSTDVADTTSEPKGQTSWSQSAAKGGRQQKGSFAWHFKGHTCQSPFLSSATSTAFSATSSFHIRW